MLNMKEKVILVLITALTAILTASLIHGSYIYNVELVSSPGGPDFTAPAREPFNISCQVLGGDQSYVSLMKWTDSKGQVIKEGTPGVVKKENNLLYLTFTDPKPEDSGIYKCAAVYADKHDLEYSVKIKFYGPEPEFETTFENLTFTEGERVEINCLATGEKPMTYKWYNQLGNDIPESIGSSIFAISNVSGSFLIIREVELHHQGMYTCSANNTHGLSSKLYYIVVSSATGNNTGNETSFIQDIEIVKVSSNSVTFRIPARLFQNNIQVKYRESRDDREYRQVFHLGKMEDDNDTYTITDLVAGGLYSFQFRILPSKDDGTFSPAIQVTLLPGKPEIIFRRIEKGTIDLEWYRPFEERMRGTTDRFELTYYTVHMQSGDFGNKSSCAITIQLPSCAGSSYTISRLYPKNYYQIEVRGHTASGFGEAATQKIYMSE